MRNLRASISTVLVAAACTLAAGSADAALQRRAIASPNWAGYIATQPADEPAVFTRATGTWVEPKVACSPGDPVTTAAIWVGIGGYAGSTELQQVGTTVGCNKRHRPVSSAWFDLYPYPAHAIPLKVRPGDTLNGTVTVSPTAFGLELTDETRHWRFARTIDWLSSGATSAEWIVEAPLACVLSTCTQSRLADFGSLTFTQVGATASTSSGNLRCPAWTATPVQLDPGLQAPSRPAEGTRRAAFASAIDADGARFTVTWLPDASALPTPASADQRRDADERT